MGMYFQDIDPPSGCQLCRFAPIVITPRDGGGFIKEQFCLVTRQIVQSTEVENELDFPDTWWEDKHLDCPGVYAEVYNEKKT